MDHYHSDIDRLIGLYLSRQASKNEKEELEEWLNASKENRETFDRLEKIWSMSFSGEYSTRMEGIRDQIWAAGTGQEQEDEKAVHRRIFAYPLSKIAAVFIFLLTGAWLFTQLIEEKSDLLPEPIAWVEKVNQAGQRSSHLLPDGTKVWLNVESQLIFPEKFSDTLRQVQLIGEAFFEVAKDKEKRFVIETDDINTVVLGTSFNIRAYPEDDEIKVALLEGKVQVQHIDQRQTAVLSPGDELLVPKDNKPFAKQQFNYENSFGWKVGILAFDGEDFNGFRHIIEKWYGVKIEVEGEIPYDWSIRARYQREPLQHVLEDISFNKNMKFELSGKEVLITF